MKQSILFFIAVMITLSVFVACGEEKKATPEDVALTFVSSLKEGRYDEAADMTLQIDSAPTPYRQLIVGRYKQIAEDIKVQNGGIVEIKHKRTDLSADGNSADVYLCLSFADKTTEEILLQLMKDGQKWQIK
ncbi:MAG: hypothetical protein SOW56_08350 [Bacteroidaceae bacterium]|nr:hypothetical protein [Bacteroidaceae bacterium]